MNRKRPPKRGSSAWLDSLVPSVAVDSVVFGFHGGDLKLLLIKWKGADVWVLPGGFVHHGESLDAAVRRLLLDRTGLRRVHLQQFHTFGDLDRNEASVAPHFRRLGARIPRGHWVLSRVVSVGYYALVDFKKARPTPNAWADLCTWYPIDSHPPLGFDHDRMVAHALATLRATLDTPTAGASLLPERFTMTDLRRLHEAILGRPLDRRNFEKRMLERGGIQRLSERQQGSPYRAPYLYRFVRTR
jgi:8-oxo-dGTP diphosphatase